MSLFVDLAFPIGVDKVFTYTVPSELQACVKLGVRTLAPFGKRTAIGIIVGLSSTSQVPHLKAIHDVLDDSPVISDELLQLTKWISEYYFAPWGEVLKAALPHGFTGGGKRTVALAVDDVSSAVKKFTTSAPRRAEILKALRNQKKMTIAQLQKKLTSRNLYASLNELAQQGYVTISEELLRPLPKLKLERVIEIDEGAKQRWHRWIADMKIDGQTPRLRKQLQLVETLLQLTDGAVPVHQVLKRAGTSLTTLMSLAGKGIVHVATRETIRSTPYDLYDAALGAYPITLNTDQRRALEHICSALTGGTYQPFLLHGVTGSGKTQVYIEAIRTVLAAKKTAIVLVPEISLTPQIVRRFRFHFGEAVTVMHSRMSAGERYDSWRLTRSGKYSIVIGPRSAVFAPLSNLGLIVVDEEQEASYKQFDQSPRYHARDVAVMRARNAGAVVILGSATPSVESYFNVLQGKYTLLELPQRVDNAKLPHIQIIDMTAERKKHLELFREERKKEFKENRALARARKRRFQTSPISDTLREKIEDRLSKKEGIILLQNRRGFAPFVECPDCGYVEMCDNCSVTLTYHRATRHLRCHYCGYVKAPPDVCPKCLSIDIQLLGIGTQRVEEELRKLFPNALMERMDLDTTTRKGSHDKILRRFAEGDIDILLGTQMVAKGIDFTRVTLVGVISADTQMLLPDFRSAERTFQLLTQVAGRAGRSGALSGEVVIQTFQPQHYGLKHVLTHDFEGFYREEIRYREELDYPPYARLVLIEVKGEREKEVARHAERFAELLRARDGRFVTLGPAPAAIPMLRNLHRWHIILKNPKAGDPSGRVAHQALQRALRSYENSALGRSKSVRLTLDVDPVGMM